MEKFGTSNSNEKPRKRNLPLREALFAAGVLISGSTGAHSEAKDSQTLTQIATRIERVESAGEEVERKLHVLQRKLGVGGEYYKDLRDETLTMERLATIVDELSRVGGLLEQLQSGKTQGNANLNSLMRKEARFPGQRKQTFTLKTGKKVECNGAYVQDGEVYFVTARHCLSNTVEEKDYFFSDAAGSPDVAIKRIPANEEPKDVFVLDTKMTDNDMHGQVGIIDTIDGYGQNIRFHTIYVKMTEPVSRLLLDPGADKPLIRGVKSGMWYVAPPQQGALGKDRKTYNYKGESGNLNFVWSPKMHGYVPGGTLTAGRGRPAECMNKITGTCTTLGFMTGIDGITNLIRSHRSVHSAENTPLVPKPVKTTPFRIVPRE